VRGKGKRLDNFARVNSFRRLAHFDDLGTVIPKVFGCSINALESSRPFRVRQPYTGERCIPFRLRWHGNYRRHSPVHNQSAILQNDSNLRSVACPTATAVAQRTATAVVALPAIAEKSKSERSNGHLELTHKFECLVALCNSIRHLEPPQMRCIRGDIPLKRCRNHAR